MGNTSCYSNTHRRIRNTTSNLIGLTNTSQRASHRTQYHIFQEKSPIQNKRHYEIPPVDLFQTRYYNTEILMEDFSNEQECAICFEPFRQRDIVARLECLCIYHQQCLDQWSQRKRCCPLHMDKMISTNINQFISSTQIKQEEKEQETNVRLSHSNSTENDLKE
jgi:hypothetical protein